MHQRGVVPDVITYGAALAACARARPPRPEKALELLATMRAEGVKPDVVSAWPPLLSRGVGR